MNNHTLDYLHNVKFIISSDEDRPVVMDLGVGFDSRNRLVAAIDLTDHRNRLNDCSTALTVNIDDARAMARRHGVGYRSLPAFVADCMDQWSRIPNPGFNTVGACLKEISECLLDERCRFKVSRSCGANGSICC